MFLLSMLLSAAYSTFEYNNKNLRLAQENVRATEILQFLDDVLSSVDLAGTANEGFARTHNLSYLKQVDHSNAAAKSALARARTLCDERQAHEFDLSRINGLVQPNVAINSSLLKKELSGARRKVLQSIKQQALNSRRAAEGLMSRLIISAAVTFIGCFTVGVILSVLFTRQGRERHMQNVFAAVSGTLSPSKPSDQILNELLEVITKGFQWDLGQLWLVDSDAHELTTRHAWCGSEQFQPFAIQSRTMRFSSGEGLPGRVWETRKAAWVSDACSDDTFCRTAEARATAIHGIAAFPLLIGNDLLGVMEFCSTKVLNEVDDEIVQAFSLIGSQLQQYLDRANKGIELRKNMQLFRAIFDHTFEFIGLLKPDGSVMEINQTALDFFSVSREREVGRKFWDTAWGHSSEALQSTLKRDIERSARGEFVRFESSSKTKTGEVVYFDFSLKPVLDDAGRVILLIPEGRDISEKKEAEKRVSEFYSTVSHELRTPLTSIRGSLGLIEGGLAGPVSEDVMALVTIGRTESDRLIRLINDILDIRKIEAGKMQLYTAPVSTESLVEQSIKAVCGMALDADIAIMHTAGIQDSIMCDADRIIQALTNLLSNAIKFSGESKTVTISVSREDSYVRFSVADRGEGIPANQMSKLFNKFQQLDQSDTRKFEGTGLGLAITKAIVEEHGGRVGVESVVGEGTTFWLDLPAAC